MTTEGMSLREALAAIAAYTRPQDEVFAKLMSNAAGTAEKIAAETLAKWSRDVPPVAP